MGEKQWKTRDLRERVVKDFKERRGGGKEEEDLEGARKLKLLGRVLELLLCKSCLVVGRKSSRSVNLAVPYSVAQVVVDL